MATPAVIIRAKERLYLPIGDQYFFLSEKEESYYVPLENVIIDHESWFMLKLNGKARKLVHHHEIVEVQFI